MYSRCIGLELNPECMLVSPFTARSHESSFINNYRALDKVIFYGCNVTLKPYYYEACLSRLHTFRPSKCRLFYLTKIPIFINTDSRPDHQSTSPEHVQWYRVISSTSFSPSKSTSVVLLRAELGHSCENHLIQIVLRSDVEHPIFFGLRGVLKSKESHLWSTCIQVTLKKHTSGSLACQSFAKSNTFCIQELLCVLLQYELLELYTGFSVAVIAGETMSRSIFNTLVSWNLVLMSEMMLLATPTDSPLYSSVLVWFPVPWLYART